MSDPADLSTVVLPAKLDIRAAGALQTEMLGLRGGPLTLDATAVERLGGLCLQVLLSARATWAADGQPLRLRADPDSAFSEQWATFGAPAFDIDPEGATA